jgi:hypothetical protein
MLIAVQAPDALKKLLGEELDVKKAVLPWVRGVSLNGPIRLVAASLPAACALVSC